MKFEYPTKLARIGSVLALVGSVIWVQWPLDIKEVGVAPLIAALAALIVWISVEAADWKELPVFNVTELDQDTLKFNELVRLIDRDTYYRLRNHNIETYICSSDYKGIEELLSYFEQDAFPFRNSDLQRGYENLHNLCKTFSRELWTLYTSDGKGLATWRSGDWVSDEQYEEIMRKIGGLNQKATEISNDWEAFIKTAQRELKGNTVGLAFYKSQ